MSAPPRPTPRHFRPLCTLGVVLGLALAICCHAQSHRGTLGYTRLQLELGAGALESGAGLTLGQVEANLSPGGTDFAPDPANPEFIGKTFSFLPSESSTSGHATGVGQLYYGTASSFLPGASQIVAYSAGHWLSGGSLRIGTSTSLPTSGGVAAFNHSWIGSFGSDASALATAEEAYLRLDHLVQTSGAFIAAGMNNNQSTALPQLLGQGYNLVTVGRSDGQHSAGFTTVAGPGRIKPDLVAPASSTSSATPMLASAGMFLRATAAAAPQLAAATDPRLLKAILLATASKHPFPEWAQTGARPLDPRFGAGEVNVYNAYRVLGAGSQPPAPALTRPARGWTLTTSAGAGTEHAVFFEIPAGNAFSRFAAALVWQREVTATQGATWPPGPRPYTFGATLPDLTLRLHSADGFALGPLVAESASAVDNLEHLHQPTLPPGRYALVVLADRAAVDFGLAWFSAPTTRLSSTAPAHLVRDGRTFTLRFTRSGGDSSLPLRLPIVSDGDALAGQHFSPALPAEIEFAAGELEKELVLTAISPSGSAPPPASLRITLAPDFASAADPEASILAFTLHARSYDAWRHTRFDAALLNDETLSGDAADPDADGLPNLLEYASGGDPLLDDALTYAPRLSPTTAGQLEYSYLAATGRPDIELLVEWTDDLAAGVWRADTGVLAELARTAEGQGERVTVRATTSLETAPRQFLRLRVTKR